MITHQFFNYGVNLYDDFPPLSPPPPLNFYQNKREGYLWASPYYIFKSSPLLFFPYPLLSLTPNFQTHKKNECASFEDFPIAKAVSLNGHEILAFPLDTFNKFFYPLKYIYIYIYLLICVCLCIYIYIYILSLMQLDNLS